MEFDLGNLPGMVVDTKDRVAGEVETRANGFKKAVLLKTVNFLERVGAFDWFGHQIQERLPKITQVSWASPEATAKFLRLTAEDFIPQAYTGHFVHLDANFMSEAFATLQETAEANNLAGKIRRAIEPVAITVANGKQDRFIEIMFPYLEAHAARRKVTFFKTTREKDVDEYHEEKQRGEANPFIEFFEEPGSATLLLPYGSIQAGRHLPGTKRGAIDGSKRLYDPRTGEPIEHLVEVFSLMQFKGRKYGQKPYFQPVTLRRSYRAQSPDSLLPTPEVLVSLYDRLQSFLRNFGFRRLVVEVILGVPITSDDIKDQIGSDWKRRVEEVNDYLMEQVAINQLPEERGEYAYVVEKYDLAA